MVTTDERWARLARRHLLLPDTRTDEIDTIADAVVALHSSDPVTVHLSALVRMQHPSIAAVERALYEERAVVRHHAMRRTLWVATPEAARAMHASTTIGLQRAERRRTAALLETNGIEDGERWIDDAKAKILATLHEHGEMTARDLGRRVPELTHPIVLAPGKKYEATTQAHTRALLALGFDGAIVRTRPVGTWISGQYRWAAADTWVPGGLTGADPRTSAKHLAERYLRRFGPATTADLQWWTGWTVRTTKLALADCGAQEVHTDDGPAWVADADDAEEAPADPWVALLPSLDPTIMGWKQRAWYLPDAAHDAFDRNGNAGPTIWADGRVVGAWAQAKDGEIRTHYFVDVTRTQRQAVEERAAEIRRWIGDTRFTVRFPGRINAVLLGR